MPFRFIIFVLLLCSSSIKAQYTVNTYLGAGKNPLNLNQSFERINSDWIRRFPFWQNPRGIYLPFRSLPFPFVFAGDTVRRFRVSNTGMLSFVPGPLAPLPHGRLPSPSVSNKTAALWGLTQKGGNDAIYVKTLGQAPNRQHWVYYHSFSADTTQLPQDINWAIVLCEGNNHIYFVDMGSYLSPHFLTIGVQDDTSNAVEIRGSPFVSPFLPANHDSHTPADNSYYEFIPGPRKARDLDLAKCEIPTFLKVGERFDLKVRFRDLSASFTDTVSISYQISGNSTVYTENILLSNATNRFYRERIISSQWLPSGPERAVNFKVWIHDGNGTLDGNTTNDTLTKKLYILPWNRWPKRHLLESHESAMLAYGVESKLNMIYAKYRNPEMIAVAWHNDSLFIDSMQIDGAATLGNYFGIIHPQATLDRKNWPSENGINLPPHRWPVLADSLTLSSSACKLDIFGFDQGNRLALNVQTTFTDFQAPGRKRLTVLLVEDSVSGNGFGYHQTNTFTNQLDHPFFDYPNPINFYIHRKVIRAKFPANSVWGLSGLLPDTAVQGQTYSQQLQFNLPQKYDRSRLSVVAFVTYHEPSQNRMELINAAEVKLQGLLTNVSSFNQESETLMRFYPNPIREEHLHWQLNVSLTQAIEIQLFDLKGKLLYSETSRNFKGKLDFTHFKAGTYLMRISHAEKSWSEKIVKLP